MGTVRFVLRNDKPDKSGKYPIQGIYSLKGRRRYFKTKDKMYLSNWDTDSQLAVYLEKREAKKLLPGLNYNLLPSLKQVEDINNGLFALRNEIKNIEKRFDLDKIEYSADSAIEKLEGNKTKIRVEASSKQLFDFIDKYITDNESSREPGSLSVYKSLKNHLSEYQKTKKAKVSFDKIDYAFFSDFQNFLINLKSKRVPNGLGNVTIAKQLSTLKTFLNYARMNGIDVKGNYKDFKIKKESLEVIALTNNEFELLYNFDLAKKKRLDQVRDIFCFSCATGLRYSDLAQLKREHIKKDEIQLIITKTKEQLSIPLNPYSHAVLEKYNKLHKPLPIISNQKLNEYLKELCKLAEINDPVQIVRFRGNRREENLYPKYELISIHTGRKTFCTLSLEKGMSAEEVMQISGHKDYQSFKRYVKITEQRTKVVMRNAWGEIRKPQLKAV